MVQRLKQAFAKPCPFSKKMPSLDIRLQAAACTRAAVQLYVSSFARLFARLRALSHFASEDVGSTAAALRDLQPLDRDAGDVHRNTCSEAQAQQFKDVFTQAARLLFRAHGSNDHEDAVHAAITWLVHMLSAEFLPDLRFLVCLFSWQNKPDNVGSVGEDAKDCDKQPSFGCLSDFEDSVEMERQELKEEDPVRVALEGLALVPEQSPDQVLLFQVRPGRNPGQVANEVRAGLRLLQLLLDQPQEKQFLDPVFADVATYCQEKGRPLTARSLAAVLKKTLPKTPSANRKSAAKPAGRSLEEKKASEVPGTAKELQLLQDDGKTQAFEPQEERQTCVSKYIETLCGEQPRPSDQAKKLYFSVSSDGPGVVADGPGAVVSVELTELETVAVRSCLALCSQKCLAYVPAATRTQSRAAWGSEMAKKHKHPLTQLASLLRGVVVDPQGDSHEVLESTAQSDLEVGPEQEGPDQKSVSANSEGFSEWELQRQEIVASLQLACAGQFLIKPMKQPNPKPTEAPKKAKKATAPHSSSGTAFLAAVKDMFEYHKFTDSQTALCYQTPLQCLMEKTGVSRDVVRGAFRDFQGTQKALDTSHPGKFPATDKPATFVCPPKLARQKVAVRFNLRDRAEQKFLVQTKEKPGEKWKEPYVFDEQKQLGESAFCRIRVLAFRLKKDTMMRLTKPITIPLPTAGNGVAVYFRTASVQKDFKDPENPFTLSLPYTFKVRGPPAPPAVVAPPPPTTPTQWVPTCQVGSASAPVSAWGSPPGVAKSVTTEHKVAGSSDHRPVPQAGDHPAPASSSASTAAAQTGPSDVPPATSNLLQTIQQIIDQWALDKKNFRTEGQLPDPQTSSKKLKEAATKAAWNKLWKRVKNLWQEAVTNQETRIANSPEMADPYTWLTRSLMEFRYEAGRDPPGLAGMPSCLVKVLRNPFHKAQGAEAKKLFGHLPNGASVDPGVRTMFTVENIANGDRFFLADGVAQSWDTGCSRKIRHLQSELRHLQSEHAVQSKKMADGAAESAAAAAPAAAAARRRAPAPLSAA